MKPTNDMPHGNTIDDLKYEPQITFVIKWLERLLVRPMTKVWIYPDYPDGWHAVVGGTTCEGEEGFYVFRFINFDVTVERQPCRGFMKNGAPIVIFS